MTKRQPCILTVGSANMDMIFPFKQFPKCGETVLSHATLSMIPGGKGANGALALAKLGARSVFCAAVGEDGLGAQLISLYRETNLDIRFLRRDTKTATGAAAIFLEEDGSNRIMVMEGANRTLTEEQIDDAFSCEPDALQLQLEIPFERVLFAANRAREKGVPIVLDAAPANPSLPFSQLPPLLVFSPNESETEIYTGICPGGLDSCMKAALALSRMVKAQYYVIKLGARGCFVYDGRLPRFYSGYRVHAVDTTAAGDAFTAALTLGLLRFDGNIKQACLYANAVGAFTVTRHGASASLPSEEEIDLFMKQNTL